MYPVDDAKQLGTNEIKDFWFDVSAQLKDETGTVSDTISAAVWTSDPTDLTLGDDYINGVYIGTFVSAPTAATTYVVKGHVTTAAGREFDVLQGILGVEK